MTGTALRAPLAAIAFLTRVPVGERVALDARDVARGAPLFPLVGGAVGGSAGLLADGLAGCEERPGSVERDRRERHRQAAERKFRSSTCSPCASSVTTT